MTDPSVPTNPELAALKAEFDRRGEQLDDLQSELEALKQNQPAQQPATPTVGRRGLLAGGGVGALALLASMGGASAATDPSDGDGDLGTSANPWDTYLDGLALVTEQVSTNTTVTKPVVLYDSALSSLTLKIDSSLEGPSGYSQPVVFIDRTGNADTNPVTVNDSGGSAVATIPAANSIFETWWDSGEWVTDRFIPTVDTGTVTADEVSITNLGAEVYATSATTVPSSTFTKIEFDGVAQDDTGSWSTSTYEFTVPRDGDWMFDGAVSWGSSLGDGTRFIASFTGPSAALSPRVIDTAVGGGSTPGAVSFSRTLKGLSQGDTFSFEMWQNSGSSIDTNTGRNNSGITFTQLG